MRNSAIETLKHFWFCIFRANLRFCLKNLPISEEWRIRFIGFLWGAERALVADVKGQSFSRATAVKMMDFSSQKDKEKSPLSDKNVSERCSFLFLISYFRMWCPFLRLRSGLYFYIEVCYKCFLFVLKWCILKEQDLEVSLIFI